MPEKKVSISIRMPVDLHAKVHKIASGMSLEGDSQLYRWIVEGFVSSVESDQENPPMSPVLEIARKIHQSEKDSDKEVAYNI
tara:strand:- start:239 stop:484 length:246 start_codon:yes stop_codon:yes gene_type:complete